MVVQVVHLLGVRLHLIKLQKEIQKQKFMITDQTDVSQSKLKVVKDFASHQMVSWVSELIHQLKYSTSEKMMQEDLL